MPRLSKARKALLTTMMKETIYEAATSVLCKHGVSGTTMNRVAEAANLAKSSLYDYFREQGRPAAILQHSTGGAVFSGDRGDCQRGLARSAETGKDPPHGFGICRRSTRASSDSWRGRIKATRYRKDTRPRFLRLLTAIFEQGIREGSFRPHNAAHTGRMFLGCFSELFELQADGASSEEVNEYVGVLIDAVLNGFSIHAEKGPQVWQSKPEFSRIQSSQPEDVPCWSCRVKSARRS